MAEPGQWGGSRQVRRNEGVWGIKAADRVQDAEVLDVKKDAGEGG